MAMSSYITLLNDVRVDTDAPKTYLTVKYAHERVGANMKYKIYCYARIPSGSYRNDSCGLQIKLDGTEVYNNTTWKPSGSNKWPVSFEREFTVENKVTGNTSLYVRFWDSQGSVGDLNYSNTWNIIVDPAGPILQKGSISQYINHLKVNVSNTITGNMTKYELAKVSDGTVVKTENLSAVTSFTVDITGLNPGVSYDGVYKIRAYANDCWGNWLTLSDTNLKTKSLPTASLGSTNPTLETNKQSINISSNDDVSSFQYELRTDTGSSSSDVSVKSESSLSGTSRNISLSSTNINTILEKYPNNPKAKCKIITKVVSNGVTYTLNELSFEYLIPSDTYKPTFDSSKITEVSNVAYTDIMGTNTSKYIKGHNRLQGKIVPMVANGYASGKNYLISCGNKQTSLNYSGSNQTFTLDNIDNNTLNVIATDSRGFTNSGSKTLTLVDYSNPTCSDINIVRQGGVGTVAVLNAKGKYTNWSGLALSNKIMSVKYKYKVSDGSYGNLIDITNKLTTNADGTWEIRNAVLDATFNASNKYDIVLVFNDRLETITLNPYRLSTAEVLLWRDLLNKRLGINKKPDYALDVDGDVNGTKIRYNGQDTDARYFKLSGGTVNGYVDATNGFRSYDTGHADTSNACSRIVIKRVSSSEAPNNGVILEFGNSTSWTGQLFIGDNANQGCYWNGWSNGQRGTWKKLIMETDLLDRMYPVGSVYLTRKDDFDPNASFGGTWQLLSGQYLYAIPDGNGNYPSSGNGSGTATNSHTLTLAQIPEHSHGYGFSSPKRASDGSKWWTCGNSGSDVGSAVRTTKEGGSQGHSHNIPYLPVYVWQRTA